MSGGNENVEGKGAEMEKRNSPELKRNSAVSSQFEMSNKYAVLDQQDYDGEKSTSTGNKGKLTDLAKTRATKQDFFKTQFKEA